MSTSGTVGNTHISVTKLIEHAVRRCGLSVTQQSAETLDIAKDNLFMMLLALANRGYYLWCLEKYFVSLTTDRATYDTPIGTIDVSDLVHSTPTRVTGTDTIAATSYITELDEVTRIVRFGIDFSVITASETVTFSSSADGIAWNPEKTIIKTDWEVGELYWFELETNVTATFFKVESTANITLNDFYLASAVYDLPMSPMSRDTYSALSKHNLGTSVNYLVEKKLLPTLTLWPIPNNSYNHLTIWVHRQIQDVGVFTNDLEIPNRWMEAVVWQLAFRLSMELPGVDPARISLLSQGADKYVIEAELDEVDGMPSYFQPSIGVYTS